MKGCCIEARWDTDEASVTQDEFKRRGRFRDAMVRRSDRGCGTDMNRKKVGGRGTLLWQGPASRLRVSEGPAGRNRGGDVEPAAEGVDGDMTAATNSAWVKPERRKSARTADHSRLGIGWDTGGLR